MRFRQKKDYGLGNTINCTSGMIHYFNQTGKKVDVFFESKAVEELLHSAYFINKVDSMQDYDFHSGMVNFKYPDYQHFFNLVCDKYGLSKAVIPHTYVTAPPVTDVGHVCIARGCANPAKRKTKDAGDNVYVNIIEAIKATGKKVVMVGSESDREWNSYILSKTNIEFVTGVYDSLCYIASCSYWVSNDTGLYHAAGALGKKGFIMWVDTLFNKNKSPNLEFNHSHFDYLAEFKAWLGAI